MYGLDATLQKAIEIEDNTEGQLPDPTFGHGLMVNEVDTDISEYNEPIHIFYNGGDE